MPIQKKRVSPRQKMINLMYVVLMAMLALNVSSDVLNGFSLVSQGLNRSTANASRTNKTILDQFEAQMKANPQKVKVWYDKAHFVQSMSDSIYDLAEDLKIKIVKESDGKDGDVNNIRNREDLEASTQVMLAPGTGKGKELYEAIIHYRERILRMVEDKEKREIIASNLSTDVPVKERMMGKDWPEYMFENMPTAAAVTLLTKLQSDVRYAEGEVLHSLVQNIDVKDIRVNQLNAYVIPQSQTVVQGGRFSAQIIMAAVDSTNKPTIYIGGKEYKSENGLYEAVCSSTGDFTLSGYIEMLNGDNPMSVSVPGVASSKLSVSMTGGQLTPKGDGHYIARPTNVGGEAVFTVVAQNEGRSQEMGKFTFRVRKLPDPTAFIPNGDTHFLGGRLSKQVLMNTEKLGAAIDDGLLNIPFTVHGFETVFYDNMGNAVPEVSQSASFTDRQKAMMRSLSRGKRFYITKIRATGPDGIERTLNGAMEVIVN